MAQKIEIIVLTPFFKPTGFNPVRMNPLRLNLYIGQYPWLEDMYTAKVGFMTHQRIPVGVLACNDTRDMWCGDAFYQHGTVGLFEKLQAIRPHYNISATGGLHYWDRTLEDMDSNPKSFALVEVLHSLVSEIADLNNMSDVVPTILTSEFAYGGLPGNETEEDKTIGNFRLQRICNWH